jgi:uracil-DNA glycosylase
MNFRTTITVDGREVQTLADILPASGPMKMLIIGKTPAPVSVEAGHYFQGRQGKMFWNRLREYGLLRVSPGRYEDEVLLEHGYGLTDITKAPRAYGTEPSDDEYRANLTRIQNLVMELQPRVLLFVYKRVLDNILKFSYGRRDKSVYGENSLLADLFHAKVFVFPMPGTPCTKEEARRAMSDLQRALM